MSDVGTFEGSLLGIDRHGYVLPSGASPAQLVAWWAPKQKLCFWVQAMGPASALTDAIAGVAPALAGRHDWVIPSIDEVQWLAQRTGVPQGQSALSHLHEADQLSWCWSSTACAWSDQLFWGMDAATGTLEYRPRTHLGHVVLVLRDWEAVGWGPTLPTQAPAHFALARDVDQPWSVEGSGLMFWLLDPRQHMPQPECEQACRALRLGDHQDWRLAKAEELALVIDRTRVDPATTIPDRLPSAWYWCAQPAGWEQASVGLYVDLADGYLGCHERDYGGLALAVRDWV